MFISCLCVTLAKKIGNQAILIPRDATTAPSPHKPPSAVFASLRVLCPNTLVLIENGVMSSTVYQFAAKDILEEHIKAKLGEQWEMVLPQDNADRYVEVSVQALRARASAAGATVSGTFLFTVRDEKKDVLLSKTYSITQNSAFSKTVIPDAIYAVADRSVAAFLRDVGEDDFSTLSAKGVKVTPVWNKETSQLSDELVSEALVASGFTVLRPGRVDDLQTLFFKGALDPNEVIEMGKTEKTRYFVTVSVDWQSSRSGIVAMQMIDAETGRVLGAGSMACSNTGTSIRYACHSASRKLVRWATP